MTDSGRSLDNFYTYSVHTYIHIPIPIPILHIHTTYITVWYWYLSFPEQGNKSSLVCVSNVCMLEGTYSCHCKIQYAPGEEK